MPAAFGIAAAGLPVLVAGGLLAFPAGPLAAQEPGETLGKQPGDDNGDARAIAERVQDDVDTTSLHWLPLARLRYSIPLEFSVGGGAVVGRMPASFDCTTFCEYQGIIAQADAGTGGGQLGVGYARLIGTRKPRSAYLGNVYVGWSARAVLVRTWGDSNLDPVHQTLAGVEGQFAVPRISVYLGVLRRISAAHDRADRFVYTAGVGWGF